MVPPERVELLPQSGCTIVEVSPGSEEKLRASNLFVKQHGEDAPMFAAMQADAMLDKGDMKGWDSAASHLERNRRGTGCPTSARDENTLTRTRLGPSPVTGLPPASGAAYI